jgi:23S rRNA pseudouridine1911/1915/1917 synthase
MEKIVIENEYINKRLDVIVYTLLKDRGFKVPSRSYVKDHWGNWILINGKEIKPSYKFKQNDILEISFEKFSELLSKGRDNNDILPQEGDLNIVYEDENYLVLNKPKGIVVHPGVGHPDNTLANYVKYYLQSKNEYDDLVDRSGVVHRLDKGVSGLIVFAKNLESQKDLQSQFEEHTVQKLYLAKIVRQSVDKEFEQYLDLEQNLEELISDLKFKNFKTDSNWYEAKGYIGRDNVNRMKMKFKSYEFGGSRYALSYITGIGDDRVLIKIETGRMHQIRATLKSLGVYIEGDSLYENSKGDEISSAIELESIFLRFKSLDGKYIILDLLNA